MLRPLDECFIFRVMYVLQNDAHMSNVMGRHVQLACSMKVKDMHYQSRAPPNLGCDKFRYLLTNKVVISLYGLKQSLPYELPF